MLFLAVNLIRATSKLTLQLLIMMRSSAGSAAFTSHLLCSFISSTDLLLDRICSKNSMWSLKPSLQATMSSFKEERSQFVLLISSNALRPALTCYLHEHLIPSRQTSSVPWTVHQHYWKIKIWVLWLWFSNQGRIILIIIIVNAFWAQPLKSTKERSSFLVTRCIWTWTSRPRWTAVYPVCLFPCCKWSVNLSLYWSSLAKWAATSPPVLGCKLEREGCWRMRLADWRWRPVWPWRSGGSCVGVGPSVRGEFYEPL